MKIQLQQVSQYLYDGEHLTDSEYETAMKLLNTEFIYLDPSDDISVFKKIKILPNCKTLICDYNRSPLTELPLLPICVKLSCIINKLTVLPPLPNCKQLYCSHNKLTELPPLANCTYLYCFNNQITVLPPLPDCGKLDCSNNQITVLPPLPNCVTLDCSNNQITELPPLPKCDYLDCSYNQITVLPPLPNCKQLLCAHNQLTELPPLPNCVTLDCLNNQITELPPLLKCIYLDCSYNQITVLPPLPKCRNPIFHHNPVPSKRELVQQLLLIRSYLSGDIDKIQDSVTLKAMVDFLTKSNLPDEFKHQNTVDFLLPLNLPFATATRIQLLCVFKILREKRVMDNKKPIQQQTTDLFGNVIVDPVMGDDGLIYDRSSMQQYFRKDSRGDYVNIRYKYQGGQRVPNFKNMGGKKQLTRYQ